MVAPGRQSGCHCRRHLWVFAVHRSRYDVIKQDLRDYYLYIRDLDYRKIGETMHRDPLILVRHSPFSKTRLTSWVVETGIGLGRRGGGVWADVCPVTYQPLACRCFTGRVYFQKMRCRQCHKTATL